MLRAILHREGGLLLGQCGEPPDLHPSQAGVNDLRRDGGGRTARLEFEERIAALGVVPVVEVPSAEVAVLLARALLSAGLPCAEVTFRTPSAAEAIVRIARELPEFLVGAGTVLSVAQADTAIDSGARFLVAPGFNPLVVAHGQRRGVPVLPGVCTPSEIEAAMGVGCRVLKFFPAEVAGGVSFLKAVRAPYPDVRFVPTGGIGPDNLAQYLALPSVIAVGGSWMVRRELLLAGDFETITRLAFEAVGHVRTARPGGERERGR